MKIRSILATGAVALAQFAIILTIESGAVTRFQMLEDKFDVLEGGAWLKEQLGCQTAALPQSAHLAYDNVRCRAQGEHRVVDPFLHIDG